MKALKITGFVILKLAVITLYVFVVMQLWNWLMPMIFGITTLTFLQTLGVLLLCKLLFLGSGWRYRRGYGPPRHMKHRWKSGFREKWQEKMCNRQTDSNEQ
ncbi:hypothetical protein [Sinomicrobium weinanense]|uniref:Uncharacterized protein n=1 Tax=Sinomicrobium weinanense TaxID=2842200 RepID=A0A926Q296_9FLAO|nr:hypothetical protein [Sinomicrobium weinanense]MBC9795624.1 hypothetical protein [Sinomicrobium weinanense]MBU3124645.1 hypothetical protein [Sinomicrobium weinanense]